MADNQSKQPLLRDDSLTHEGTAAPAGPSLEVPPQQSQPIHPSGGSSSEVFPSAPPADMVEAVPGYEGITFQSAGYIAPPTYDEAVAVPASDMSAPPPPPTHVSQDQARQSLLQLTSDNFCWGRKAAEQIEITFISSSSAFHYKLDTFTEQRKTSWAYEPYAGQPVDSPMNGPAPRPWDIPIQPDAMFQEQEKFCEVPHTASVKTCHDCRGSGSKCCYNCHGSGRNVCNWCNGSGFQAHVHVDHHHHHGHHHHHHGHHHHGHMHTDFNLCHHCAGSGYKTCHVCHGCGQVNCRTCATQGQLKCYIKLTVLWKVHSLDHIVESTALPSHLLRKASGQIGFEESGQRIAPVGHFPNPAVNSASQRIVQQHSTAFQQEKILMQHHQVRVIPVSEVNCNWKGKLFSYWVYGTENTAYAPEYPQQCCCGCNIL